ncbi:hypothetical protein D3C76_1622480 [compost metagenome]
MAWREPITGRLRVPRVALLLSTRLARVMWVLSTSLTASTTVAGALRLLSLQISEACGLSMRT